MICPIKIMKSRRVREGAHSTMNSVLASHPVALGLNPGISEKKLSMLPGLIDSAAA